MPDTKRGRGNSEIDLFSLLMNAAFIVASATWMFLLARWFEWTSIAAAFVAAFVAMVAGWCTMMGLAWVLVRLDRALAPRRERYCMDCGSVLPDASPGVCPKCGCRGSTTEPGNVGGAKPPPAA